MLDELKQDKKEVNNCEAYIPEEFFQKFGKGNVTNFSLMNANIFGKQWSMNTSIC